MSIDIDGRMLVVLMAASSTQIGHHHRGPIDTKSRVVAASSTQGAGRLSLSK